MCNHSFNQQNNPKKPKFSIIRTKAHRTRYGRGEVKFEIQEGKKKKRKPGLAFSHRFWLPSYDKKHHLRFPATF
jgi:hypothetical protein